VLQPYISVVSDFGKSEGVGVELIIVKKSIAKCKSVTVKLLILPVSQSEINHTRNVKLNTSAFHAVISHAKHEHLIDVAGAYDSIYNLLVATDAGTENSE